MELTGKQPIILRRIAGLLILRILWEQRMHGYDIWKRLEQMLGLKIPHPIVYRILKEFEDYGLVKSDWEHTNAGPARKVYSITQDGISLLRENLEYLRRLRDILSEIIEFAERRG